MNLIPVRGLWRQTVGLLGHPEPAPGAGYVFRAWPCILHTLGMRYAIDVVWCDRHGVVVAVATVAPWRPFVAGPIRARAFVEMRAGWAAANGLRLGTKLLGASQ